MSVLAPQLSHGNSSRALRATNASTFTTQPQPIPSPTSTSQSISTAQNTHRSADLDLDDEDISGSQDSYTTPPRLGLGLRSREHGSNGIEADHTSNGLNESQSPSSSSSSPPSPTSSLSIQLQSLAFASPHNSPPPDSLASPDSTPPSTPPLLSSTSTSSQLLSLYEATLNKLFFVRSQEKILSSQAGQLLKSLQNEESVITILNTTLKRTRHQHKKLLGRITAPRWEVKHHYHMTCMEHSLGHLQPHVLDVAEMLPGHLRLYSIARCASLIKRQLTTSTSRAKSERNTAADQIKEGYRQLREVRAEMKELMRLVEAMNAKTHLLPSQTERSQLDRMIRHHRKQLATLSNNAAAAAAMKGIHVPIPFTNGSRRAPPQFPFSPSSSSTIKSSMSSPVSFSASTSIRMKYLKSLNLAPKPYESIKGEAGEAASREERERVAEVYNNEWKTMMMLFHSLELQKRKKEGESKDENENTPTNNNSNNGIINSAGDLLSPTASSSFNNRTASSHSTTSSDDEGDHISPVYNNYTATSPSSDLKLVQSYRKRMGIVTLPQPSLYDYNDNDSTTGEEENSTTRLDPGSPLSPSFSPLSTSPSSPHIKNNGIQSPSQTPVLTSLSTPTTPNSADFMYGSSDHSHTYIDANGTISLTPFTLGGNSSATVPVQVPTPSGVQKVLSNPNHSTGLSTSAPVTSTNFSLYNKRR